MTQHTPGPWGIQPGPTIIRVSGEKAPSIALVSCQREEWEANARLIAAAPDLLELAKLVAREYEDAADWKDARGKLASMARAALDTAGIVEDAPEEEDDYNPHWPVK